MALDMFLELAGIAGESTDPVHKGEIQISSWSWGLSEPASAASGESGAGAGKVSIQNIVIQKNADIASPLLIQHCAQGARIASGTVSVRKAGATAGAVGKDFLLFKMTNVLVMSVTEDAAAASDLPTETVTLAFSKFEFDYSTLSATGALGAQKSVGWDLATAKVA
jgi:type VI secretion system secreted protein Hcp